MSSFDWRLWIGRLAWAPRLTLPLLAAALVTAASCTSSETSQTLPSIVRCAVTATNAPETLPAAGGSGTVTIDASRDCTWTAANAPSWIEITSATNGQGGGTVTYRAASNSEPVVRRGTIDVNNIAVAVSQEAAPCRFTVTPSTTDVGAAGGDAAIRVQTNAVCRWTAASEAPWIRVTAGASGQGDGSVTISIEANSAGPRSGRVIVAGTPVVVEQSDGRSQPPPPPPPPQPPPPPPPAPACSYSIQPGAQTIAAAGGTGTIDVTASAATCAWTAVSNAAWLTIASGASATGSNRLTFNAAANPGAARSASITVAGHTFTVSQTAAACSYSIDPSNASLPAAAGTTSVAVSAGSSCAWTTVSNASWITVASGASGTGAGSVTLNIAANPGAARTGTVTIAGRTFTVMQGAAPCAFALSPASVDVPAAGGDATTTVTTTAGCAWTAASNANWITIADGSSGTGTGTVRVTAAANAGAVRTGTVTIGGQTLTVQQAAPCTFALDPQTQTLAAAGGTGSVTVTTGAACSWTAVSNNTDWLTVTGGSPGTGSAPFTFSVAANSTGADRVGTITAGGVIFTLTQTAQ